MTVTRPVANPARTGPPGLAAPLTLGGADAVLCDFNGTLSDDEMVIFDLVRAIADERLGVQLSEPAYFGELAGLSDRAIFGRLRADSPRPASAPSITALVDDLGSRYRHVTGDGNLIRHPTRRLVQDLAAAGVPLGLVTGAARATILPALRAAGILALFDVLVTEDDVEQGKPDPEGFLTAARLLAARPERTIVLEDSVPGLAAARSAGMRSVALAGTHPAAELRELADLCVSALTPSLASRALPASPPHRDVSAGAGAGAR